MSRIKRFFFFHIADACNVNVEHIYRPFVLVGRVAPNNRTVPQWRAIDVAATTLGMSRVSLRYVYEPIRFQVTIGLGSRSCGPRP